MNLEAGRAALRTFHPRNWAALVRSFKERSHNHCHILSRNPAIVYLWWGRDDSALHEMMRNSRLVLIYFFPWCTYATNVPIIAEQVRQRLGKYPKHRIILSCAEEFTVELFRQQQVEAVFCNQNAFIDENTFKPLPDAQKKYDAVYCAAMASYKRHALASEVKSLMLMTYRYSGTYAREYEQQVLAALPQADWVKNSYSDADKVSSDEMVRYYNLARVGLCLSEVEGAMGVSMEYMQCGLPVVSTPSVGGRDVFFDPACVIIAPPNPAAIAQAVAELIGRKLDPSFVRSKVLEKVQVHRDELRRALGEEIAESKLQIPWPPGSHGICEWTNLKHLGRELQLAQRS